MASLNIGKVDTDKVDRAHLADLVSTLPLLIRAHETLLTDTYIRQTVCSCANLFGVFILEISIAGRMWPKNVAYHTPVVQMHGGLQMS